MGSERLLDSGLLGLRNCPDRRMLRCIVSVYSHGLSTVCRRKRDSIHDRRQTIRYSGF